MLFRAWGERQRRRRGDSALWRMNFFGEKPVGTERTETSRVDSYLVGRLVTFGGELR